MKILLVIDSLGIGGAERHVVDLACALRGAGHSVSLACATAGPLVNGLEATDIPIHTLMSRPVKRRIDLEFAWKLHALLRRERFDLVHAHLYASAGAAALALAGVPSPLVVTVHSEGAWQGVLARLVSRLVYRRAQAVVAVSAPIAQAVTGRALVPPRRVVVIPNALSGSSSSAARRLAPEPEVSGGAVVGVVARLQREKGVDLFLEALGHLGSRHLDLRSVVVGDGPLRANLERRARSLGASQRVVFLGSRTDAPWLIPTFDLLVVPSRTEGSPLVVLEAMAAGVAVVAARVGGIPDQITHGVSGWLVSPNSPGELAGAIDLLLRKPALRLSLAQAGKKRISQHDSYGVMVRRIEDTYFRVLAERIRPVWMPESSRERVRGETIEHCGVPQSTTGLPLIEITGGPDSIEA